MQSWDTRRGSLAIAQTRCRVESAHEIAIGPEENHDAVRPLFLTCLAGSSQPLVSDLS